MTLLFLQSVAAAVFSLLLAFAGLLRKKPTFAGWCFFAGMVMLGVDSVLNGQSLRAADSEEVARWQTLGIIAKSFLPGVWICFSLVYSRGNHRQFLARWTVPLVVAGLLPICLSLGFRNDLLHVRPMDLPGSMWWVQFGAVAKVVNVILLIAPVLILMNLEQTFRSAVGTMRWRIKFVVLGLGVIFGARIYVRSQAVLFSGYDLDLTGVESGALLVGCCSLALAYARSGFSEIEVYPSLAVLRTSLTVLFVGGYLFVVGVLAQVVAYFGGADTFQFQSLIVLLGMAGLAVILLSDRLRQEIRRFAARHFRPSQHDSLRVWTLFSRETAKVQDATGLCAITTRLVSEIFDVLSVTIWLREEGNDRLIFGASTGQKSPDIHGDDAAQYSIMDLAAGLDRGSSPFDLERVDEPWAEAVRQINPSAFPNGGARFGVPLMAGEKCLGIVILADRVNGVSYTFEELDLLKCIGDQIASSLLNLRLVNELVLARELEAFRTMSAFFVHDLKNAAASLNLMLKNLPVHFDDPAFREDALRGVANTAGRIDVMIGRLSALRERPQFRPVETDLNQLVSESLERINGAPDVEVMKELHPLPAILADREQIESVVTNLVLNARDAVGGNGRIQVRTDHHGGRVVLSVADNGCGMSRDFLKDSLFRPFHSTKKKGLGIGMFQSRMIVEAHRGSIQVESETGKGTTFRVSFPSKGEN